MSGVGAWIRYGNPIAQSEIKFAAEHYRAAILQPWELEAAAELKARRPDMTVLCYKCLSSTRDYEPGPIYSSGISYKEARPEWFATRQNGERIEWQRYPGHWQMKPWNMDYRYYWMNNVVNELRDSPFDGVMADNDVFDDYYGLNLPLSDIESMADIRRHLGYLVGYAGEALNEIGKILVPNIAESRREEGRWETHAKHGGGFEEVWLGYSPTDLFDQNTALAQVPQLRGPGISIMRVPTDGNDHHPNFLYGLATFWIFGAGRGAYTATGHDDYSLTQFVPELSWDLGRPISPPQSDSGVWQRQFTDGWAAVNMNESWWAPRSVRTPYSLIDIAGIKIGGRVTLGPKRGIILRRH